MAIPTDGSIQATYSDGYVLSEDEHSDISPYNSDHNILRAILNKDPEAEHGSLIMFSVYYKNNRYDIDFTNLPDNARPVRWKRMEADTVGGQITEVRLTKVGVGYQYNDENGKNIQEVIEL